MEVCTRMQLLSAILYAALAFTSFQPQNSGLEWNRKSTLSTDRPVEFHGTVHEAGVYIVRLRQAGDRRSFVDILNQDETQVLATVVAVPDHRQRPDGTSEFTFHEVQGDGPKPVQTWYFPGDLVGLEFVYPKARAKEIAHGGEG